MVLSRRLNVQKFHLEGTPRKVLYHSDSGMLLVMRTDLNSDVFLSDICCVDPQSGSVLSSFILDPGETGKSMELVRVGSEQVLVVGTSLSSGPVIMPNGEDKRSHIFLLFFILFIPLNSNLINNSVFAFLLLNCFFGSIKGRLFILCLEHVRNSDSSSMTFCSKAGSSSQRTSPCHDGNELDEHDVWKLRVAVAIRLKGSVLAICSYLDRYFLASVGNAFIVCGFPDDKPQIVRKYAEGSTRFMITSLTSHCTRIAVGDCRDGVLLYSYHEDTRKLELRYCDPSQRLVADCILMDADTAVVSDREGSISVLCSNHLEERNLTLSSAYYMSEVAMSIRKCGKGLETNVDSSKNTIVFSTLLGSTMILIRLSREEYELFEAVQARLVIHPLTAPVLGNNHAEFRTRETPVGAPKILDGDMLTQFLELTCIQQEAVLSNESSLKPLPPSYLCVDQVVQLLERVHKALI